MFIVALNGSPNKNGNTRFLLDYTTDKIKSLGAEALVIDIVDPLSSLKNPFCTACSNLCLGACYKNTKLEEAFNTLKKADGIIIGSPSYFGSISAQIKAFFDKTRKLRSEKAFLNTVAAGITVGASTFGGQETTLKALHDIMLVHGMIIVGDGYKEDDCGHHGVCSKKTSSNDEFALKRAEVLAKRIVEVSSISSKLKSSN